MPRVPLTLPVADKVQVPPSPEVLRGVPKHRHWELKWKMRRMCWICYYCWVVGGWVLSPLATGGRAGRFPRRGSGAFTLSSGLPRLSTEGLRYTILRFIVDTTTLLNTYTSQRVIRSIKVPNVPVALGGDGAPLGHENVPWGASPSFTEYPNFRVCGGSGGMAPPTDTKTWLGRPPLLSRSIQTSLSAEALGGWRPPRTWTHGLGVAPYFTECPNFLVGINSGGMAPPTDSGPWCGGPPLSSRSIQTSLPAASQGESNLPPTWYRDRGASPYFTESPSSPIGGRSRGRCPPLTRPRDWGGSPSFRRSPDNLSLISAGRRRSHDGRHAAALGPHPMMHLRRNTRCVWDGGGTITSPGVGWATGRPGEPSRTATPRWSPPCTIVAPPRWPAGDGARDLTTQPPWLDWVAPHIAC